MPEHPNPKLRDVSAEALRLPAGDEPPYAELEAMSNFSFLRGASHPDELVFRATELGYRAIAITDFNSLAGVVRAHDALRQVVERGGKPPKLLIGARLTLRDGPDVLAWATNRAAYGRLCRLLTLGKGRAEKGQCALDVADVLDHQEGLLAAIVHDSSPQGDGPDFFAGPRSPGLRLREAMADRLSIAVSCLYGPDQGERLDAQVALSRRLGIPLLATNSVHYHVPERRMLQDVLTCIRNGCTIYEAGFRLFPNAERYLKSPAQMRRLFADHPQAIHRGMEIVDRCGFSLDELRYEYPAELVPEGARPIDHLGDLAWQGALRLYAPWHAAERSPGAARDAAHRLVPEKVQQLLRHELELIEQLRFEAYFLTVHDLVRFARSRGILCQGRGSAANSAVCYCLGITCVDPARMDLLFERFISAARNEPPDIDVDFEHERREEVIQYIYEKYGRQRAGMTAEVITYRGRSAVRDVGKAIGLSLDLVDQMAKKLDWWHRGTLQEEQIRELGLDPGDATIRWVVDLTSQLLGFPRHLSQHVGGMVMTRGLLCELVPIENAAMPGRTVIEWDKNDIDALGILKVDVLALGMLTCISKAMAMVNAREQRLAENRLPLPGKGGTAPQASPAPLQLHTIPPEDPAVYAMLCKADSIGVFQVESRAQMSMLPRLRPRRFYDLVIQVAIVRPGPIQGNMVHPYLRRRNGEESVSYPGEALRQVLEKTLGVPLFQEQAMRIAMVGAGFSAADADRLRRAMAAWRRHGELDGFHEKIVQGMLANGYTREFAEQCFLQIRGFGEYGFPESHAASFALLVYISAWIKRYHPAAFAAALINSQPMGFYAPAQIVRDARDHGVAVLPIDVNFSQWDCTLENSSGQPDNSGPPAPALRLGFRLIKGMRWRDAHRLAADRARGGAYRSIAQLHRRTALPRHAIQRLAEADAFGSLGLPRRRALWQAMELSDAQLPLFDDLDPLPRDQDAAASLPPMPLGQEVLTDYQTAGLSLKRHPVALVRRELEEMGVLPAMQVNQLDQGRWVRVAGLVLIRQRPGTASGIVFVTIEDETGIVNLIIRPQIYDRYRTAARQAGLLHAEGYLERQGDVVHLLVWRLHDRSHLLDGHHFASRDFH